MSSTSSRFNSCCSLASTLHYEYELKLSRNHLVKRLDKTCQRYLKKHPVSRLYDYSRFFRIRPRFIFTEIPQVCGIEYCCHAYLQGFCGVGKSFNKKTSKQFASEELLYKIMFGDGTNEHPPERYVSQRLNVAVVPELERFSSMESLEQAPRPLKRLPQLRGAQQRRYRRPYQARARSHNGDTRSHNGDSRSLDGSSQSLYGGSRRSLPELFTLEYERNAQSDPEMDQTAAGSLGALNGTLGESSSQLELRSSLPEISSTSYAPDNHAPHQRLTKGSEEMETNGNESEQMSQDEEAEDDNSANEENASAEESAEEENEAKVERQIQRVRTPIKTPSVLSDIEEFCEDEEGGTADNGTAENSNEERNTDEKLQGYLEKYLEKRGDARKPMYVSWMKNGKYEVQCTIYINNKKKTTCGKGDKVNDAKEISALRMLELLREREVTEMDHPHAAQESTERVEQLRRERVEHLRLARERAEHLRVARERAEHFRAARERAAWERAERSRSEQ